MPENHKLNSTTKSKAETAVTDIDNIESDVNSVDDKDIVDIEIDDIDDELMDADTASSISSIERNKVSPAVNTLKAILTVLGSDLTTFFSDEWKEPRARVIVTPKDLLELNEPNSRVSLKQVYNCSTTRNLGFLIETYQPNSSTEEKIAHEGEEIGTVIEGKIIIRIEESTYLLNQGDSYVIDTTQPHTFINPTDSVTRIVSAHTPTTY